MHSPLSRYRLLAKRWTWLFLLGVATCSSATYLFSTYTPPIYQATALLVISLNTSYASDTTSSIAAVPTYAQLVTNPLVLDPIVAQHSAMTLQQLNAMLTVKPQPGTQIVELDVQNNDPKLATLLANEISASFLQYARVHLPGTIQIFPAQEPLEAIRPKPLQDGVTGALIGGGLAVALIVLFEWIDDRLESPEEIYSLLGIDILTILPWLSHNARNTPPHNAPISTERYRMLSASLNIAQSIKPFKLLMVTSARATEGKSAVAANIATFLAMAGKRVLLVDANMRHPSLNQRFQLPNARGLSNLFLDILSPAARNEIYGQATSIPTLRVLTSGLVPARPAELLQSPLAHQLFTLFKEAPFDYIIFDSPPLLPVADAQILAALVQSIVLVIDAHKTPRRLLLHIQRLLKRTHTPILGIVLNKSHWLYDGDDQQYMRTLLQTGAATPKTTRPTTQMSQRPTPITPVAKAPPVPAALIRPPLSLRGNAIGSGAPQAPLHPQLLGKIMPRRNG